MNKKKTWHRLSGRGHFSFALFFFGPFLVVSLLVLNPLTPSNIPLFEVKPALADDGHPMGNPNPSPGTLTPTVLADPHQMDMSNMGGMSASPGATLAASSAMPGHDEAGHTHPSTSPAASHSGSHESETASVPDKLTRGLIVGWFGAFNLTIIVMAGISKRKNTKKTKARLIHR